ncbi:hypothetical protein ACFE04_002170 [Oxalis oulophora]
MKVSEDITLSELVLEIQASAEEVSSSAKNSESDKEVFIEFSLLVEKFAPVLNDLVKYNNFIDTPPIRKSFESLHSELIRAKALIVSSHSWSSTKKIEDLTQDLGRSFGLMLFASLDLQVDVKQKIGALQKELMNARFDFSPSTSSCASGGLCRSPVLEFVSENGSEIETEEENRSVNEIEEEKIDLGPDDVVLQLKFGNDESFRLALLVLNDMISGELVNDEWIIEEGVVSILFNRLGSGKPHPRVLILQILRSLASRNPENKENMIDAGSLSTLVKALARDIDERRVAVGLLLEISNLSAVRRRLGRIQGCIVMLVTILNGDDTDLVSSRDAGKLLDSLSSNTQSVLHMAEAGYFKPLVQYLKNGSDMCKILMATSVSRMELTDQSSILLGEEGAVEPLVNMFKTGKLESKLSALSALQNLSDIQENIQRLISSGIVATLLQLLFSVTSVLMTLREPASAILTKIAKSESILVNQDIVHQMVSLLNLSSPIIQRNLLQALNSICAHSSASKVLDKMKENCAVQIILPFLSENNTEIRTAALNLVSTLLSADSTEEFTEHFGETHINTLVRIILTTRCKDEKAAALSILCNLPTNDKKTTDVLIKANLVPILVSLLSSNSAASTNESCRFFESVAGILIRFTIPADKKLQHYAVENRVIPLLVKFLSNGSILAKERAATSLAQLSQNSISLIKSRKLSWLCVHSHIEDSCKVHNSRCSIKKTFCLIKAGALSPLIKILEGQEREADESVLSGIITLLHDDILENGCNYIAKMSGVEAIIKILEVGNVKAQEKALWILERIFGIQEYREKYGESAQVLLIDLAQNGDSRLRSMTARILAQLDVLQGQSSYF